MKQNVTRFNIKIPDKSSKLFSHIEKELHLESGKILESPQLTSIEKTIHAIF